MPVKIRLARTGRRNLAKYNVVVADSRSPRDGRFIEKLGIYNPNKQPGLLEVNEAKAVEWLLKGAQPSDTIRSLFSHQGIMFKKHLQVGVNKGAITQEQANTTYDKWKKEKEAKLAKNLQQLSASKEQKKKAKMDAEVKAKQAKEEAIKKKNTPVETKVETTSSTEQPSSDQPTEN